MSIILESKISDKALNVIIIEVECIIINSLWIRIIVIIKIRAYIITIYQFGFRIIT